MAVRVTSEDANDGFKPTCGLIDELSFRSTPEVRRCCQTRRPSLILANCEPISCSGCSNCALRPPPELVGSSSFSFFVPPSAGLRGNDARVSVQVWGYFSVKSGGGIHEFSDSQVSFHECSPLRSSITGAVYCFMPWKQRHT